MTEITWQRDNKYSDNGHIALVEHCRYPYELRADEVIDTWWAGLWLEGEKLWSNYNLRDESEAKSAAETAFKKAVYGGIREFYLEGINRSIGQILQRLTSRRYSEEQVDELLTKQREICRREMDTWCEHNNYPKCGHIVLYAPRP